MVIVFLLYEKKPLTLMAKLFNESIELLVNDGHNTTRLEVFLSSSEKYTHMTLIFHQMLGDQYEIN